MSIMKPKIFVGFIFFDFTFISFAITNAAIGMKLSGGHKAPWYILYLKYFGFQLYGLPLLWLTLSVYFCYKKDPPDYAQEISFISGLIMSFFLSFLIISSFDGY
jgi:hypothetical protein